MIKRERNTSVQREKHEMVCSMSVYSTVEVSNPALGDTPSCSPKFTSKPKQLCLLIKISGNT